MRSLLVLGCLGILGCTEIREDTSCNDYCDMKTEAASQDAVNQLCSVDEDDLSDFESKCNRDCSDALNYFVDKDEQDDASSCLRCYYEAIEEPSHRAIVEAQETCFIECNNLGSYQFFFSFFISPPTWDC